VWLENEFAFYTSPGFQHATRDIEDRIEKSDPKVKSILT
jgi:hypothetical protein